MIQQNIYSKAYDMKHHVTFLLNHKKTVAFWNHLFGLAKHSSRQLEHFTHRFAKWAGSAMGFIAACLTILVWFMAGGKVRFSDRWESDLDIYIAVITFLMIFLFQRAQNKELIALHAKLNELIAATKDADNRLINVEELTEQEILEVQEMHRELGKKEMTEIPVDASDATNARIIPSGPVLQ